MNIAVFRFKFFVGYYPVKVVPAGVVDSVKIFYSIGLYTFQFATKVFKLGQGLVL